MKAFQKFIAPLAMVWAVQIGLTTAQANPANQQISEELAAAIAEIEANFQDADERIQRIALLIARTTRSNPVGSAPVLADLSSRLSVDDLSVVSAAAVMSSGTSSPAVVKAMIAAQEDPFRVQAIRDSATRPTTVLGTRTAALLQPVELAPLPEPPAVRSEVVAAPVPVAAARKAPATLPPEPLIASVAVTPAPVVPQATLAPVLVAAQTPIVESDPVALMESTAPQLPPVTALGMSQPPPMQPGGLPPRPPALPYRGQ